MATDHENWIEQQSEIYALGALDGEELRLFESHLAAGCAACESRIREARETFTQLPRSLEPLTPPSELKARLFDRLTPRPTRAASEQRRGPLWRWWFAGAGALAAAALVFVLISDLASSRRELARLNNQLAAIQAQSAQKDQLIKQKDQLLDLFAAPDVRAIELAGLAAAPKAKAKLFWNPAMRRGLLITSGLPTPDAGKAYELWGIAGNEPVPAGVFSVDAQGRGELRLTEIPGEREFDKFAVTLEPAGGVAQPSGPMMLLGSL